MDQLGALIRDEGMSETFSLGGYPPWSFFVIKDKAPFTAIEIKTLMMQTFFENGILGYGTHNMTYAHTEEDVAKLMVAYKRFFECAREAFSQNSMEGILKCKPLEPLFKVR
jgi:glutamate-1-semialdehyde 2,1-aminomutase